MNSLKIEGKEVLLVACPKNMKEQELLAIKNLNQLEKSSKIKRYEPNLEKSIINSTYVYQQDKQGWKATPKVKKIFKFTKKEKIPKIIEANCPRKSINSLKKI